MPTGLTYKVAEQNVSLREFIWICARHFGALIHMRDDPADANIPPEIKPNTDGYYESIRGYEAEIAKLEALTDQQALAMADYEHARAVAEWHEIWSEDRDKCIKFRKLHAEVLAWNPPTSGHEGLKKFMLEQLELDTEESKCLAEKPKRKGRASWRAGRIAQLRDSIKFYKKYIEDEVASAKERTEWIQAIWRQDGPLPKVSP